MLYDIIVIGAGSGGLNIAGFMNKAGFRVLLIDRKDGTIGGDCLNYGCVPSKALIHVSRLINNSQEAEQFGVKSTGKINLKKVKEYVKSKQEIIRKHENAEYFRSIGMNVVLGEASFAGKNLVKVNGKLYRGKKIVFATGSRPRKLEIPGIEKVNYLTNETIFDLQKLPAKLAVIGGGPIGIELGQAFQRLGSQVTIIERGEKFLPKESAEITEVLRNKLIEEGVKIIYNASPLEFKSEKELILRLGEKKALLRFDQVLVSIGRVIDIDSLNLSKAGIRTDKGKIIVDEQLRTTNKKVLVCGDVVGSYQFTHAAELHAGVIITNFFSPLKKKINYDKLSWVTYTSPEIATFGQNEKQLQDRNIVYERLETDFKDDDRSIVDDYTSGKLILYVSKDRILGGSMVAMNAGELFQELGLALTSKIKLKELFNKVYPYPTATRINKRIISKYFGQKLTESNKKILRWLY